MNDAIQLAILGRGAVEPNPMVGCVIVRDDKVIGAGWHRAYGAPHAERDALSHCAQEPAGATAYVTLEPCCHTDKKTPPCVPALIQAKIARVVVGCLDPNPQVNGRGAEALRAAGIEVQTGVLESACHQLIAPFVARVVLGRPYVTVKWAQSADGKVAGAGGQRVQITGPSAHAQVHALRGRSDAILVGIGTAWMDDPLLTARDVPAARPLLRVVADRQLRLPVSSKLVRTARTGRVRVYCESQAMGTPRARALRDAGVQVAALPADANGRLSLSAMLRDLRREGLTHLMVESGPTLAGGFLTDNLVDRLWVFRSARKMDQADAPSAPAIPDGFKITGQANLDEDELTEYLNPQSPAYFSLDASPDLQLAQAAMKR